MSTLTLYYGRPASVEPYEKMPDEIIDNDPENVNMDPKHASQSGARPKNVATCRRPISHIPDKHDQVMLELKAQKMGDTQIARILNQDGGDYDPKTIGTRHRRLRTKMMAHNDEPLELKEMQWTEEEDALLLEAHGKNVARHQKEHAMLDRRFFEDVAFSINGSKKDVFYSADACNTRYQDLIGGTAKPHPDQDDNPRRTFDDMLERLAVFDKKEGKESVKKAGEWETTLFNEGEGKRVCKIPGQKRASGKRRPKGEPPAKKQKVDKHKSDAIVAPEDDDASVDEGSA